MESSIETTQTKKVELPRSQGPRIYVADLAAYTNGILHGRWIDAAQDHDDIMLEIQNMLDESPVDGSGEYAIHDSDGFGSYSIHEHEDIGDVSALADLITIYGEAVASGIWQFTGSDYDESLRIIQDQYQGSWDSLEEWAEDLLESTGELDKVPEHLSSYIDIQSYARDLELSGEIFTIDSATQVHIFLSR